MTVLRKITQSLVISFISFYSIGIMQSNWLTWGGDSSWIPSFIPAIFAFLFLGVVITNILIMDFKISNISFIKIVDFFNLGLSVPIFYLVVVYIFHYQYWHDDEISNVGFPIILTLGLVTFTWVLSNGLFLKKGEAFLRIQSTFVLGFIYTLDILIVMALFYLLLFSSFSFR